MDHTADLRVVKRVIENETAYSVGKNCSLSYQSVDKFKKGTADILNMKLKNAIEITEFGKKLEEEKMNDVKEQVKMKIENFEGTFELENDEQYFFVFGQVLRNIQTQATKTRKIKLQPHKEPNKVSKYNTMKFINPFLTNANKNDILKERLVEFLGFEKTDLTDPILKGMTDAVLNYVPTEENKDVAGMLITRGWLVGDLIKEI